MKCHYCGREIPEDSVFCEFCGKKQKRHRQSGVIILLALLLFLLLAIGGAIRMFNSQNNLFPGNSEECIDTIDCHLIENSTIVKPQDVLITKEGENVEPQKYEFDSTSLGTQVLPEGNVVYSGISYGQCIYGQLVEPKDKVLIHSFAPVQIESVYICAKKWTDATISLLSQDGEVIVSQRISVPTWGFNPPLVKLESFNIIKPGYYYLVLSDYNDLKVYLGSIVDQHEFSYFYQHNYERYCSPEGDIPSKELLFRIEGIDGDHSGESTFSKPFRMGFFYNIGVRRIIVSKI